MKRFKATHELALVDRVGDVRIVPVMFVPEVPSKGGPAYTKGEWDSGTTADWEFDPSQREGWKTEPPTSVGWTFQGGSYPGRTLTVRRLKRR